MAIELQREFISALTCRIGNNRTVSILRLQKE